MIKTRGLTRVALSVCDPERSLRFFHQIVGAIAVCMEIGALAHPADVASLAFL